MWGWWTQWMDDLRNFQRLLGAFKKRNHRTYRNIGLSIFLNISFYEIFL